MFPLFIFKMLQASNEDNLLREINELISGIENGLNNASLMRFSDLGLQSIFYSFNRFANALFEGLDLEFIPLFIITELGIRHFNITKNNYASYLEFIKNNQQPFKALHETIRNIFVYRGYSTI